MPIIDARRVPVATYRLQLHNDFTFSAVENLLGYFNALGISELYFSPIFRASPGSQHGYDVSDYRKISPDLGGGEAFVRLAEKLKERQMSVLLDFVPNHMGIQGAFNNWWRDVLECGPQSTYASYFDIQWNASREPGRARVLVPILEDHYGDVLENGKLSIIYNQGAFFIGYGDLRFPVNADTYSLVLGKRVDGAPDRKEALKLLDEIIDGFGNLPTGEASVEPEAARDRAQSIDQLKRRFHQLVDSTPAVRVALEERLAQLNGSVGSPESFDELDCIVDRQHYRLARWKAGVHEINYRRFFAVDSLIGLRMENPQVFHESHLLLRSLIRSGWVMGLRIDHIDGLWDPREYLDRLQHLDDEERPGEKPLYVLVEKIRERHEELPGEWATHGTTGYEFISQLAGLFVDAGNESRFTTYYRNYTGKETEYADIIYSKKRLILDEMFANAVTSLGNGLAELVIGDRRWRDLTAHELVTAVREVIACFDVYRTYRRDREVRPEDLAVVNAACDRAIVRNPRFDSHPIEFLRALLTGAYPPADADPDYRLGLERWVMTLQQYTGAVMAKSVEDTAFYTYSRFLALNEVGGNPGQFGATVEEFHATNLRRLEHSPLAMLTTSTHDTKLSEDVRARLYTLSEIPAEWEDWVAEWRQATFPYRKVSGRLVTPDPVDEYRLYQILIGVWPIDGSEPDDDFRRRIREHMRKAVNEAKRITSWTNPNEEYLKGCDTFIDAILTRPTGDDFLAAFVPRARRVAHLGIVNSLAQVVLKATVPGIPDYYQGNEVWDFSLVDPDNRRPVDYKRRGKLLADVERRAPRDLLRDWLDGGIKLWTTQRVIALRHHLTELMHTGDYVPCVTTGRYQRHVTGFRRSHHGTTIAVVVPRLSAILGVPPLGLVWDDTAVEIGEQVSWEDWFTGRRYAGSSSIPLANLFTELPFAILVSRPEI